MTDKPRRGFRHEFPGEYMTLDERRTREELISELDMLRDRVARLESLLPDRNDPVLRHDFQGLFDAFDTPVSLLDTHFRFQAVNAAYEEYLGVARETLIGRTPAAIVGEEVFRNDILGKLQRCLEGEVVSFSLWVDYKGKGRRLMNTTYAPRLDRTGRIEGLLHISRDITQRHHIEQEAAAIAETAFSGYLVVDGRGHVIDTNGPASAMLGYSREEILRLRLWDIDALVSEEGALEGIRKLSSFGRIRFETRLRTSAGTLLDVEVSATYLEHDGGKVCAFLRDITRFRRIERELRESERQYRSVVDNMLDVYFRTDNAGFLTMVSPSSAAMFRFASHEEAIGRPATSFYKFPEEREKVLEELRRSGFVRDFEATFVRDDGTTFHVSANSAFYHDENGNILGVEGVLKDITQRKETQQRIERSEAKFRSLFHHAGEGIFIVGRDMSITDANHAAARILGYDDPAELVGLKPGDILHPDDVLERSVKANITEAQRGKVLRLERRYRRKDGSYVPVQITVKSLKESGMHHVLFSDISERKRMEEALKTKIVALTQPAGDCSAITFESVFDMEEIQRIQDEFARATGVASLITRPDGVPLTRPSNFQRFCSEVVRKTTLGACNCSRSDAVLGLGEKDGPRVQQCLSAGLWDAGASIRVGGRHVASWLIGQVRDEAQSEDAIRAYALEIGADEEEAMRAFRDLPVMSKDQFQAIAQALHTLTRHISVLAFQNLQQARFIEAKNRAEGNHRLLAEILNTSDSIAVYKDTALRYMMVNNEFLRLTGYESHSDVVGKTDQEVMAGLVVQEHLDRYAKTDRLALALPRGESLTVEESYPRRDGSARVFQTKKFPIFDGDAPEPIGMASLSSEITEVKRIQYRLAQEKARAEAASTAKTEFLANMSHEIRTPLNGISGMMQLLRITELDQEQEEYVEMAMRSTTRLTKLLTDILDISRIEAGKLEVVRREFRVHDLVQSVSELFDVTHREKGVTLLCRIDPGTPEVLTGDEARIRQILFNLVGNAFKFTDRGGVTLEIYPVHSPKDGEQRIAFSVHDTGIGIPEDRLRELFTPFAQVETTYSRAHQGAGLGLAIVKRLATLMDGHVIMDTLPGEGTSVYVILPFLQPKAATGQQNLQPASQMEPLPAMHVLLVEDDRSNRFFMLKLLEKAGVRSSVAENGREAIELWETGDFDCILMDIQMPVMDGVEATKRIRNSQAGAKADIPIIALTSYAMAGDQERFLAAGMDAYLGKPVRWADLWDALEAAYRKSRDLHAD